MVFPAGQRRPVVSLDVNLQTGIVERYLHDILNARRDLVENDDRHRRAAAEKVLADIAIFFADHLQSVVAARDRLAHRTDRDGRAFYALIDEVVSSHATARTITLAVLDRLRRDR